jgi:tryptophan 2-C-methyltransferase
MRIALVNTNRIRPPIAPIGLDYVAEALVAAGHEPELLDLCWEEDPPEAITRFFAGREFGVVGVTLRNVDDCGFTSRESFLPGFAAMLRLIREHSGAPMVLGGVGFSTMPEYVLASCGAEAGVWGDGEFAFPEIASRIERGEDWRGAPNLVLREAGVCRRNPPAMGPLDRLPSMSRAWVDNRRYFDEGGQAGFETRRGCACPCVYCADPVAKGALARVRPPAAVADEIERLLAMGIDHLHTCDPEFNMPVAHAFAVCDEFERRGLGEKLRWYAYCAPSPFSPALARAMRRAGCVGINFGTDSGDAGMLRRLGRGFGPEAILDAARWCRDAGIAVMLDLLLGAPGETRESILRTVDVARRSGAERVGASVAVRVYPGTPLAAQIEAAGAAGLTGGSGPADPLYFLEPAVAPFIFRLLDEAIAGDPAFLFHDPSRAGRNYNYNANQVLVDAIARGCRGAYWDILRRCRTAAM